MNFQILNVENPNSVHNTCVFTAFQAVDTLFNLHVALDRYSEQVDELQQTEWRYVLSLLFFLQFFKIIITIRGKQFRVFLSGDYEFLCKMYGISGASGILPLLS